MLMTADQVSNTVKGLRRHHTATKRGYVGVNQIICEPYNKRYGEGYAVYMHNPNSTQYCYVTYYVKN